MSREIKKIYRLAFVVLSISIVLIFGLILIAEPKGEKIKKTNIKKDTLINKVSYDNYFDYASTDYSINRDQVKVKGIYISHHMAGYKIDPYIELANDTKINSFVIDIKTDLGNLSFKTNDESLKKDGIKYMNGIRDIHSFMDKLRKNNIYPIARIVTFKDNYAKNTHPEWMIKNKDGSLYKFDNKTTWLNPYDKRTWDYIIRISKEAAKVGFKEIQFDYVRFHERMYKKDLDYSGLNNKGTQETIAEFIKYANKELTPLGLYVSADVFGGIITSDLDSKIVGQDYVEMSKNLDAISPMIYPSHYHRYLFGPDSKHPNHYPYKTIKYALDKSEEKLKDTDVIVRPWLQAFSLGAPTYGEKEIKDQIKAVYDTGHEEWIMWSPGNRYNKNHYK